MRIFGTHEAHEWEKWLEDGAIEHYTTMTLCTVRKKVEENFGKGIFSNQKILEAIQKSGGRVTNRPESYIGDFCLISLEKFYTILQNETISQNRSTPA